MADRPSVARNVHYVAFGTPGGEYPAGVCRAAIITQVHEQTASGHPWLPEVVPDVGLCILNPTGMFFNVRVQYDPTKKPGTWHWPERV